MARKNQGTTADDVFKRMFPDLPTSDDVPVVKTEDPADKSAQTLAALQAQIAELQGQVANTSRANQALSSQAQVDMPPAYPQIDYAQQPDPVADPKGFAAFNQRVIQATVAYERDVILYQQRQQARSADKTATLWKDFESSYGDYAKNAERVEIAAARVINKAAAKGIDTDKYMYANSPTFMKDVVSEMDRLWPNQQALSSDDDGDDDDDPRTAVFGGGVASGSSAPAKAAPQRYGNLSQDIMSWQEKTGFHR